MPSKSKKQHNFMAAIAHSKDFAKKVGVPMSVGKDFVEADKGRKFGTGGSANITRGGQKQINKQVTRYGSVLGNEKNIPNVNLNKYIGKKEGGMATMKMHSEKGEMKADTAQDKKMIKKAVGMHDTQLHGGKKTNLSKLKGGGMARMASKGEHPVQKQAKRGAEMVKMAKGGLAAGHKSADGIATKGKTRAMAPAMRKGGKVC
jgi:hypothetical protein